MFNDLIVDLINATLSAYFDGLTRESFKLSVLNSNFEMNNLEIYSNAFLQHEVPIIVEKGIIKSIKSSIPWKSFMTDPLIIEINDIVVNCRCLCWPKSIYPTQEEIIKMKEHQLKSHELFKSKFMTLLTLSTKNFLKSMYFGYSSKAKVLINRINIRIEFGSESPYILGLNIHKLIIDDPKPPVSDGFNRSLKIQNFGIYIDKDQSKLVYSNLIEFFQQMELVYSNSHNWILIPQDITGSIKSKGIGEEFHIESNLNLIDLIFYTWQIDFLLTVSVEFLRFDHIWKTKFIQRPKSDNPSDFWNFIHSCAKKINQPSFSNFSQFSHIFKLFRKYTKLWKGQNQKNSLEDEKKNIENLVPYRQLVVWRAFSEKKNSKWLSKKLKLNYLNNLIENSEIDGQFIFPSMITTSHMSISSPILRINLLDEISLPLVSLELIDPLFQFHPTENGAILDTSWSGIKLYYEKDLFFESVLIENQGFFSTVHLFHDESIHFTKINSNITSNFFKVYINILLRMKLDSDLFNIFKRFLSIVHHPSVIFPTFNLTLETPPSQFILYTDTDLRFLFVYSSLKIHTPSISKFDFHVIFTLLDGSFSIGEKNDFTVLSNINIKANIHKSKSIISFLPLELFFDWKFITMFAKTIPALQLSLPSNNEELLDLLKLLPPYSIDIIIPNIIGQIKLPHSDQFLLLNINEVKIFVDFIKLSLKLSLNNINFSDLFILNDLLLEFYNFEEFLNF